MTKNLHLDRNNRINKSMEQQHFNPMIEAVTSIRHLVIASSKNWTTMKTASSIIENKMNEASLLIKKNALSDSINTWEILLSNYKETLSHLKIIMDTVISKIKSKKSENVYENWEHYHEYTKGITSSLKELKTLGIKVLPQKKHIVWESLWSEINDQHRKITNEANACSIQLEMIEAYTPKEVDELSDTILKHIPIKYSKEEAHLYTDEYMKAYETLKKEATQKKNLWDKFLDILAGGTIQTPAQRVMMQRWVEGEKGELH